MRFEVLDLVLAGLAGGGVGFLSGVFGIGGGFLLVPVLSILLKIPMEFAVGAGAAQVLGPATTSLLARRIGWEHVRLPLTVAGGLLVGVFVGARLFELAKAQGEVSIGEKWLPLADLLVLLTYLVLLLSVGVFALWEARAGRTVRSLKRGGAAGWPIPPYASFPGFVRRRVSIPVVTWFGLGIGFFSGLLGMSGGVILLPGLVYLLGMRTHQAVLSSLVIVWLVAVQATVAHAWHENIDLTLVIALLAGGTVGARFGSEVGLKLAGRQLRRNFGWLLIGTAVVIGGRLVQMLMS